MFAYGGVRSMFLGLKFNREQFSGVQVLQYELPNFGGKKFQQLSTFFLDSIL